MRTRHGFSLLELAVVLVILAIVLGLGVTIGQTAVEGSTRLRMQERLSLIKQSLDSYARHNGYLPCPAGPALTPANANYGRENRPAVPGLCTLTNGVIGASNVYYGAVPVLSLGLDESYMADEWGNKLTYMVSQNHIGILGSYSGTYMNQVGTILVVNANYSLTTSPSSTDGSVPGMGATYAVISHGKNRAGAYTVNSGTITVACPAATTLEYFNCGRAVATGGRVRDAAPNEGSQATTYFDDYVVWGSNATWRTPIDFLPSGCPTVSGQPTCETWCAPCELGGKSAAPMTATRVCAKFITRNGVNCEAHCIWPGPQSPCP